MCSGSEHKILNHGSPSWLVAQVRLFRWMFSIVLGAGTLCACQVCCVHSGSARTFLSIDLYSRGVVIFHAAAVIYSCQLWATKVFALTLALCCMSVVCLAA